jgi:[ribosomal protein S5]-alanine N-acetyltransferase
MRSLPLAGEAVVLREFTHDDVPAAAKLVGDDRVTRWLSFDSRSLDETDTMINGVVRRAQLMPRTEYYLAVVLPPADEVVGFVRLGLAGVQAAKLGYAIHADHWGHGYATDAARTLIDFGFVDLELHRITAAIGPDNAASITVVQRLGFQYEGCLRDHVWTNGAWRDSQLHSLLSPDWMSVRSGDRDAQRPGQQPQSLEGNRRKLHD